MIKLLVWSGTFWHRYCQQISDKHGQHTGNANWRCKGRDGREDWYWAWFPTSYCHIQQWWRPLAEVSCFYSYHYILCIYLSINNHCLENATFDPLHRHCSSENSITYWWSFFPSSYIWGIVLQIVINEMPERFGSTV